MKDAKKSRYSKGSLPVMNERMRKERKGVRTGTVAHVQIHCTRDAHIAMGIFFARSDQIHTEQIDFTTFSIPYKLILKFVFRHLFFTR